MLFFFFYKESTEKFEALSFPPEIYEPQFEKSCQRKNPLKHLKHLFFPPEIYEPQVDKTCQRKEATGTFEALSFAPMNHSSIIPVKEEHCVV
jgi:hypothetical protein